LITERTEDAYRRIGILYGDSGKPLPVV